VMEAVSFPQIPDSSRIDLILRHLSPVRGLIFDQAVAIRSEPSCSAIWQHATTTAIAHPRTC
jgi:hypothetical protein